MASSSDPPAIEDQHQAPVSGQIDENKTTATAKHTEPTTALPAHNTTAAKPTTTMTTTNIDTEEAINADFHGEVLTDNTLPSLETLRKIEKLNVLDASGKSRSFKSLYAGNNAPRRVLIIFVRHFFCGMCQQYLRTLSEAITPESLLELPVSTFITVIGCGGPALIPEYIEKTGCPFPVYADPTRSLYKELGMVRTLNMGPQPAYMKGRSVAQTVMSGVAQGLKHIRTGLVTKMGDTRQVGGEFLFEPNDIYSPISTPAREKTEGELTLGAQMGRGAMNPNSNSAAKTAKNPAAADDDRPDNTHDNEPVREEKRVTWCHRMRTTRDHAEIPEILEVLGLPEQQLSQSSRKASTNGGDSASVKAASTRKGTGLSLASQMRSSIIGEPAAATAASASPEQEK